LNIATTPRADRIEEMISGKIKKGEKISVEDVRRMQQDVVDVFARDSVGKMLALVKKHYKDFTLSVTSEQVQAVEDMSEFLSKFNGNMTADSVQASVFSVWEYLYRTKLFMNYTMDDTLRNALLSYIDFDQFLFSKIHEWHDKPSSNIGEDWCQSNATVNYSAKACVLNLVKALSETREYMVSRLGSDRSKWTWGSLHIGFYKHAPFSETPLKVFYNREFPSPGNRRTVNAASHFHVVDDFRGFHSPNYRMVVDLGKDGKGGEGWYVIDTGVSENALSKHYDDQQKLHRRGEYVEMKMGRERLGECEDVLVLVPKEKVDKKEEL